MNYINNKNGFTLIEVMITTILLATLVAITVKSANFGSSLVNSKTATLIAAMGEIESSYGLYLTDKNQTPNTTTLSTTNALTDTTFVPTYLMVPNVIQSFDSSYGTSGYILAKQTGQAAGNNGWYIATKVVVNNSIDMSWQAIKQTATKISLNKFYYNTAVASVTNMPAPSATTTVFTTYWLNRY